MTPLHYTFSPQACQALSRLIAATRALALLGSIVWLVAQPSAEPAVAILAMVSDLSEDRLRKYTMQPSD